MVWEIDQASWVDSCPNKHVSFYSPNELPSRDIEHLVTLIDILSINEQLHRVPLGTQMSYRFRELMEQVKEYVCGDLEDRMVIGRRTIYSMLQFVP